MTRADDDYNGDAPLTFSEKHPFLFVLSWSPIIFLVTFLIGAIIMGSSMAVVGLSIFFTLAITWFMSRIIRSRLEQKLMSKHEYANKKEAEYYEDCEDEPRYTEAKIQPDSGSASDRDIRKAMARARKKRKNRGL